MTFIMIKLNIASSLRLFCIIVMIIDYHILLWYAILRWIGMEIARFDLLNYDILQINYEKNTQIKSLLLELHWSELQSNLSNYMNVPNTDYI